MASDVKGLDAQLQPKLLGDREFFDGGEIHISEVWPADEVAAGGAGLR